MRQSKPTRLLIAELLLFAAAAVSIMRLYRYDPSTFGFCSVFLATAAVWFLAEFILMSRNMLRYIARLDEDLQAEQREALLYLPIPTVVLDATGCVVWYNKAFQTDILGGRDPFGLSLTELMPVNLGRLRETAQMTVQFEGRVLESRLVQQFDDERDLITVCFEDRTDYTRLSETFSATRPAVLLFVVDNYDDVLQNAKESEKSAVFAAVENLLESFISETTGILKRLASDRFLAVIEEQHLAKIKEGRFRILETARGITVGDRTGITFSIGVGSGAETLDECEQIAKQCLDMALGRGGDQAAVKTETGFQFYGGVSKAVEKKSRAKARIIANALTELLNDADRVFLMGHRLSDLDSVGAAAGLAGASRLLGCNAHVVINRDKTMARELIDRLSDTVPDLFLGVPEALSQCTEKSLLIVVDTHNKDILESTDLYHKAKTVVVIDHHRKCVNFIENAVVFHHEIYASSASELVTELVQYCKGAEKLPTQYAEALLAGIMLDTKNFVMRTGVRTFEAAAFLRKMGADTVRVKELFSSSIELYRFRSQLVSQAELHGRYAISVTGRPAEELMLTAPQAADELLTIQGVEASFVIYPAGDRISISARSLGAVNVQVIMEQLGGGGHQTMAATQLSDSTPARARQALLDVLEMIDTYE